MYLFTFAHSSGGRDGTGQSVYAYWFHLWPSEEKNPSQAWSIGFLFPELLLEMVHPTRRGSGAYVIKDETDENEARDRLDRACIRFAVRSTEQRLRDGLLPPTPPAKQATIYGSDADVPLLRAMFTDKTCAHQVRERADLYCSAATPDDETRVGTMGHRVIAPTSRALCRACALPDTDFICSHLLHPQIQGTVTAGGLHHRVLAGALCDVGQSEIDVPGPSKCHAGGNDCWTRLVDPAERAADAIQVSPLTLAEAIDFLDASWRLAFGKDRRLQRLPTLRAVAELATPVTDRAEFDAKLTAIADLFKSWTIPDDLLPEGRRDIDRDHTLVRLEAAVGGLISSEDGRSRLADAVATLRDVNNVRRITQHSGAARDLPSTLARLGIPYPPEWPEAWTTIQIRLVQSLAQIRDLLLAASM
jgi:hypothetical protein